MDLAKPRIDVGLFTTKLEPMLDFWQNEIGLPFDHMLPLGGGVRQHRHDLLGSVLKINHSRHELPISPPSGYRELLIAREGLLGPKRLADPDGNQVTLIPPGMYGIERIGIRLSVRDVNAHRRFYAVSLGLPDVPEQGGDSFLCGDSVILFEKHRQIFGGLKIVRRKVQCLQLVGNAELLAEPDDAHGTRVLRMIDLEHVLSLWTPFRGRLRFSVFTV